jgi:hypothetical protein
MDGRADGSNTRVQFANPPGLDKPCGLVLSLALLVLAGFACSSKQGGGTDGGNSRDASEQKRDSAAADVLCYTTTTIDGDGGAMQVCYPACSAPEDCATLAIPGDRCETGYTCMIAFVKGPLACIPFCNCKDLLGSNPPQVPIACLTDGGN